MAINNNRLKELLKGDPTSSTHEGRMGYLALAGMSVEQFGRKIGVTRAAVYYYLSGKHRPTLETLAKICKQIDITLEEGRAYCEPTER